MTTNNSTTITSLDFLDDITKTWLNVELSKDGPWSIKNTIKEKVNCFLNLYLAGDNNALDLRAYLCNHDEDEVWINSIRQIVLPYILNRS